MAVITVRSFDCTPSSLLASAPCLGCVSEKEMLAAMLAIFATANNLDMATILKNSACYACMSKKDMLQAIVTVFGNELIGAEFSVQEIIDQMKCVRCGSEQQILAALLYMFCNYFPTAQN